jgi:hypothetical protein
MEQIASDISSSEDRNIKLPHLSQSLRNRLTKLSEKARRLTSDQVMRLVYLIATFEKPRHILATMKEEFGVTICQTLVDYYRRSENYKPVIQRIREKWGNDIMDVQLATKRRRMQELEHIYKRCLKTNQMKCALTSLYQIQHEVEKDLQQINQQTNYQINIYKDLTETELEEERIKSLERLKTLKGEITCLVPQKVESVNPENKDS